MSTLTLEISEKLDIALRAASIRRHISPSTLAREVLEKILIFEDKSPTAAEQWLLRWRGTLREVPEVSDNDARLARLLAKHLR
ncbi:conserved hypothetical protein [Gammaproteobacteria bacterium]